MPFQHVNDYPRRPAHRKPDYRPNYPDRQPLKHKRYHCDMTLIAGFVHKDGVLLCGDARVEGGTAKEAGIKILPIKGKWGQGLIAYAGSVDYAIAAIQKIERKMEKATPRTVLARFEKAAEEEWHAKIGRHPLLGKEECPSYDLLLAIRPVGQDSSLHVVSEATVHQVKRYRCLGSGADLAAHVLKPLFHGRLPQEDAVTISAYALAEAKRSVVGVDDLSVFYSLRNDGTTVNYVGKAHPRFVGTMTPEFDRHCGRLLRAIFSPSDSDFKWNVEVFSRRVERLRAQWLQASKDGIPTTSDELPGEL